MEENSMKKKQTLVEKLIDPNELMILREQATIARHAYLQRLRELVLDALGENVAASEAIINLLISAVKY
jgi:hypothetical protein